ncbi:MAG: ectoine hydroxylase-related dioxygenase (phytanoyl-CoA dioxygenase family) [Mariniblastus sp.]|jgi:ectoine hydroxylase-related dioxygenase (phytanoyl-CoA dioxygenase family)
MSTDYSLNHGPVSELFKSVSEQDFDRFRLSDEQVEFFHKQGYLAGIKLFDDEQIETLKHELSEFFDPSHSGRDLWHEYHTNESGDPNRVLFHALGAWRIRPGFHDILWNPAFLVPASQLLGGSVRFWHDQLFCKPAKHGGNVAWHQDYSYWTRTKPMAHLTCWTGLDPATAANGCLNYIPGSHLWELLPVTGLAGDMQAIQEVLTDQQWAQFQNPVAIELEPGHCTFHHPLMVHGSFDNKTEIPRRAVVLNVIRDGVASFTDEELLAGVPVIPKGEKMNGQFFPLLLQV